MNLKTRLNLTPVQKQITAFLGVMAALLLVLGYWWYSSRFVSTDDAYVNANVVQVSSQVTGQVMGLPIVNNQYVKAGQVLFTLDPTPYQLAVDKANYELTVALQNVSQNEASVAASVANVAVQEANLQHARVTTARTLELVKQQLVADQSGDDAIDNLETAKAALDLAKAQLQQAKLTLAATITRVEVAKAILAQAKLNLQYTVIRAPVNGQIANLSLRVGAVVSAAQAQFALVAEDQYWVDANFEETDLSLIKPGQLAEVKIDMYGGERFKGVVQSVSGGSGQAFSLLPAQNATGNWVKVTQRVPVRVMLIGHDSNQPLPIGTSAFVKIDTHQSVQAESVDVVS